MTLYFDLWHEIHAWIAIWSYVPGCTWGSPERILRSWRAWTTSKAQPGCSHGRTQWNPSIRKQFVNHFLFPNKNDLIHISPNIFTEHKCPKRFKSTWMTCSLSSFKKTAVCHCRSLIKSNSDFVDNMIKAFYTFIKALKP